MRTGGRALRRTALAGAIALALVAAALVLRPGLRGTLRGLPPVRALRESVDVWRYENTRYPDTTPARVGDGGPAGRVRFQDPMGLAEDADGNVYVADRGHYVWRVDRSGVARVVAGTGRQGAPSDGARALESDLGIPEALAADARGRIYVADSRSNAVLRIDPDGRLARVAGSGRRGFAGDGGPAREARLNRPFDVALDREGNLFIADYGNHRIRRVDRRGMISTVAGDGRSGYTGDGGSAAAARLSGPYAIAVDAGGRLWIADSGNHVVRRVDAEGRIQTVAGTGARGYTGDGGPASEARFDSPQGLFVDAAGRIYVNDEHNHAIRRIGLDGVVEAVAGRGEPGWSEDGTPAAGALLGDPESVLVRADGSLLLTEGDSARVRSVGTDGRLATFAGSGLPLGESR